MWIDKSYLLQMLYFKGPKTVIAILNITSCFVNATTLICCIVLGLLMPFTGEESKSLEYLVDCYNQSKNIEYSQTIVTMKVKSCIYTLKQL